MPLNSFVHGVLSTEEYCSTKSFCKQISYNDRWHTSDTTVTASNSDFGFTGSVLQLRNRYKNRVDYSSGYLVFQTQTRRREGKRSSYSKFSSSEITENVCLLDLDTFKRFFADPKALAEFLTGRAKTLVTAWMEKNAGADKQGRRTPVQFVYSLQTFPWRGAKQREERSTFTLQLNTYGYTALVQQHANPKMGLNDIKVLLKLKSTLNSQGPNQAQGSCQYDGFGYACPFLHWAGLLKSDRFEAYVKDIIETDPGTSSAEGSAETREDAEEDDLGEEEEGESELERRSEKRSGETPETAPRKIQKRSVDLEDGELNPEEEAEQGRE